MTLEGIRIEIAALVQIGAELKQYVVRMGRGARAAVPRQGLARSVRSMPLLARRDGEVGEKDRVIRDAFADKPVGVFESAQLRELGALDGSRREDDIFALITAHARCDEVRRLDRCHAAAGIDLEPCDGVIQVHRAFPETARVCGDPAFSEQVRCREETGSEGAPRVVELTNGHRRVEMRVVGPGLIEPRLDLSLIWRRSGRPIHEVLRLCVSDVLKRPAHFFRPGFKLPPGHARNESAQKNAASA